MRYSRFLPIASLVLAVLLLLTPIVVWVVLVINLLLLIFHSLLQGHIALAAQKMVVKPCVEQLEERPLVSIHLPIHAEPPHLVCATIESILRQTYSNYELLVLDNNTMEEALWKPVEEYCRGRARVQFFHLEQVKNYKAGALNICRSCTAAEARYIFTVDADYVLTEDCLEKAVATAECCQAALVQFPQAYSNAAPQNEGLVEEYRHYFALYANYSNTCQAMLGTGTLSLLRLEALDAIGGWPTASITEDAELGVALQAAGYTTLFVDEEMGHGRMPATITGLRQQRLRWIFGNFQTLLIYWQQPKLWAQSLRVCTAQLTAWINFCGIAFLVLALECARVVGGWGLGMAPTMNELLVYFSLGTIVGHLCSKLWVFGQAAGDWNKTKQLFFTHLAYTEGAAFAWWDALVGYQKPFVRTNKFISHSHWTELPLGIPIVLACCGGTLAFMGNWIPFYMVLGLLLLWSKALWNLWQQTGETRLLEQKYKKASTLEEEEQEEDILLLYTQEHTS